jgi:hypothetical protein
MGVWIAVVVAGFVGLGYLLKRASSSTTHDAGAVSESWLREQRADKRGPFA